MITQKKDKSLKFRNRWNWLDDAVHHEKQGFTFPQVNASLIFYETPASLDGKVPLVPGPSDMVVLATTKIGTKRFRVPPDAEFDLSDPYRPPPEYNFLHDPHLHEYLNNPLVQKGLREKGLVTKDGFVKCTIKEFNDYRQWIRKLKLDAIDQNRHLSNQRRTEIGARNHETSQVSKQRQARAKQLYDQKEKKKEQEMKNYLKCMEEKEIYIESLKKDTNRKYEERRKMRNEERHVKLKKYRECEKEGKKLRIQILFDSKKSIKKREERVSSLHQEKLLKKEKRAEELWKRKQSYCLAKMEEEKVGKEQEESIRRQRICRRDNIYQREKQKSDVCKMQRSKENRDNAMKHLEEASEFLNRIEAKKEEEIRKWRKKLKDIEEREDLLEFNRQKKRFDQKIGKYRRCHSKSRKSGWDVEKVLLSQMLEEVTPDEKKNLDELSGNKTKASGSCTENEIKSECDMHLQRNTIERKPNSVSYGDILLDDVIDIVYHEDRRPSLIHNQPSIPGLVIQHIRSTHEHLPCVYEDIPAKKSGDKIKDEPKVLEGECLLTQSSSASPQSSYEILVIPSRTNSLEQVNPTNDLLSNMTLVHLIDDDPVLVSSAKLSASSVNLDQIDNEKISLGAKQLVHLSLGNAARDLGYSAEDILGSIGVELTNGDSITFGTTELNISEGQAVIECAKRITNLSLISVAVYLGYNSNEIAVALGIDPTNATLQDITAEYNTEIRNMATEAVFRAALGLGYSKDEALSAVNQYLPSISRSSSYDLSRKENSLTILSKVLAKSAVCEAAENLGFKEQLSKHTFVKDIEERHSSLENKSSSFCLTPVSSLLYDEPFNVVAHNALRLAAFSLGYSNDEVLNFVGPEKLCKEEATLRKLAKALAEKALQNCCRSEIETIPQNLSLEGEVTVKQMCGDSFFNSLQDSGDSEFLVRRYSSSISNPSHFKVPVKESGDLDVWIDAVSRELCENAIIDAQRGIEENVDMKNEPNNLKFHAQQTVIVESEKNVSHLLIEESQLKEFALKFSLAVIGSAGKILGFQDRDIMIALSQNVNKGSQNGNNGKDDNVFVKFNEESIDNARRESLSMPDRERRNSIKDRPLTPKPTAEKNDVAESENDNDKIRNEENESSDESVSLKMLQKPVKQRRPTPFYPPPVQKMLIEEFKNNKKANELIIVEEEEEEIDEEEIMAGIENDPHSKKRGSVTEIDRISLELEERWSTRFSKKVERATSQEKNYDFSYLSKAEVMPKIIQQNDRDIVDRSMLSEYPTEAEFMDLIGKRDHQISKQRDDNKLLKLIDKEQLPKGILDLYSSINCNVSQCLSELCSTTHVEIPCQIAVTSPKGSFADNEASHYDNSSQYFGLNDQNTPCNLENKSSNNILPNLDSVEQVCLTGSKDSSIAANTNSIQRFNKPEAPELPRVESSFTGSRLSVGPRDTQSKSSVPSLPRICSPTNTLQLTSSKTGKQHGMKRSVSTFAANIARDNTKDDSFEGDNLLVEETENVMKTPIDFETETNDIFEKSSDTTIKKGNIVKAKSSIDMQKKNSQRMRANSQRKSSIRSDKTSTLSLTRQSIVTSKESPEEISIRDIDKKVKSSSSSLVKASPSYAKPLKRHSTNTSLPLEAPTPTTNNSKVNAPRASNTSVSSNTSVFERLSTTQKITASELEDIPKNSQGRYSLTNLPLKSSKAVQETRRKTFPFNRPTEKKLSKEELSTKEKAESKNNELLPRRSSLEKEKVSSKDIPISGIAGSISTTRVISDISRHKLSSNVSLKTAVESVAKERRASRVLSRDVTKDVMTSRSTSKQNIRKNRKKRNSGLSTTLMETKSTHMAVVSSSGVESKTKTTSRRNSSFSKPNNTIIHDAKSSEGRKDRKKSKTLTSKRKLSSSSVSVQQPHPSDLGELHDGNEESITDSISKLVEASNDLDVICELVPAEISAEGEERTKNMVVEVIDKADIPKNYTDKNMIVTQLPLQNMEMYSLPKEPTNEKSMETGQIVSYVDFKNDPSRRASKPVSTINIQLDSQLDVLETNKSKQKTEQSNISTASNMQAQSNEESPKEQQELDANENDGQSKSNIRFQPSPPPGKISSSRLMSQSLKAMVSNRAMRAVSKSKSLGSAGRSLSSDSRHRHYASLFKESIPLLPLEEGENQSYTDFTKQMSSINSLRNRRTTSQTNNSSVWVPAQSFADQKSENDVPSHSPSAVLVKAVSSRKISDSSFQSGHIFVTPVESINFISSQTDTNTVNYPAASSKTSVNEVVEKHLSGMHLSNQSSVASNVDSSNAEAQSSSNAKTAATS